MAGGGGQAPQTGRALKTPACMGRVEGIKTLERVRAAIIGCESALEDGRLDSVDRVLQQIRDAYDGSDPRTEAAVIFDDARHAIFVAGEERQQTPTVWKLLEAFRRREGRICSHDYLMDYLYGDRPDDPPFEEIIPRFICNLRRSLRGSGYVIRTCKGHGWLFEREGR